MEGIEDGKGFKVGGIERGIQSGGGPRGGPTWEVGVPEATRRSNW